MSHYVFFVILNEVKESKCYQIQILSLRSE